MKSFVIVFAIAALSLCNAEDDGQYRPELYNGDDGQYHPGLEGRFANNKYKSIYAAYEPVYYKTYSPYQQLLTPYITYGDQSGIDQYSFPSTVSTVTYRPPVLPVVSTVAPIVYSSTAKPIVEIKPVQPVVQHLVQPAVQPLHVQHVQVPLYRTQYNSEANARVIKSSTDIEPNAYHYSFETDNGIVAEEAGTAAVGKPGTSTKGFYEYIGDNGLKYRVDYIADANGYRASGAHLPKA